MTSTAYPYAHGYCEIDDVTARIRQGQYRPDQPGNITSTFIEDFITQAATAIDLTLGVAGYTVPIVAQSGTTIGDQVWTLLKMINAVGAAAYVEQWRHAEDAVSQDGQADRLYSKHFMSMMDKLARGRVLSQGQAFGWNLGIPPFNLAGTWEPVANPSASMDSGTDDPDWMGNQPAPIFTINPTQSATSPTSPSPNPLSIW